MSFSSNRHAPQPDFSRMSEAEFLAWTIEDEKRAKAQQAVNRQSEEEQLLAKIMAESEAAERARQTKMSHYSSVSDRLFDSETDHAIALSAAEEEERLRQAQERQRIIDEEKALQRALEELAQHERELTALRRQALEEQMRQMEEDERRAKEQAEALAKAEATKARAEALRKERNHLYSKAIEALSTLSGFINTNAQLNAIEALYTDKTSDPAEINTKLTQTIDQFVVQIAQHQVIAAEKAKAAALKAQQEEAARKEQARQEAERVKAEKAAKAKLDADKLAQQRQEAELLAKAKEESARRENAIQQQKARIAAEAARLEAEKEKTRLEAEKTAAKLAAWLTPSAKRPTVITFLSEPRKMGVIHNLDVFNAFSPRPTNEADMGDVVDFFPQVYRK